MLDMKDTEIPVQTASSLLVEGEAVFHSHSGVKCAFQASGVWTEFDCPSVPTGPLLC